MINLYNTIGRNRPSDSNITTTKIFGTKLKNLKRIVATVPIIIEFIKYIWNEYLPRHWNNELFFSFNAKNISVGIDARPKYNFGKAIWLWKYTKAANKEINKSGQTHLKNQ